MNNVKIQKETTIKRRNPCSIDDLSAKLQEFATVQDMMNWAKGEFGAHIRTESLNSLAKDINNGLSLGLARMRLGNLCRGASSRRVRDEQRAKALLMKQKKSFKKTAKRKTVSSDELPAE